MGWVGIKVLIALNSPEWMRREDKHTQIFKYCIRNKMDNLEEMDKFLGKYNFPK